MVTRAIVVFPVAADLAPIAELRHRFDPLATEIAPHITLVFPFESTLSAEDVRAHVESAVRGVAGFSIRLREITGHEGQYLFLNVEHGKDMLIDLHDRLYSGALAAHRSREHMYVPHVTVGRVLDPRAFQEALTEAAALDVSIDARVASVSAYRTGTGRMVESDTRLI